MTYEADPHGEAFGVANPAAPNAGAVAAAEPKAVAPLPNAGLAGAVVEPNATFPNPVPGFIAAAGAPQTD